MPAAPAHTVYPDTLSFLGRGYALWNPSPTTDIRNNMPMHPKALELGDVGYIFEGSFHRLFNVHLPADHPDQGRYLPENFDTLTRSGYPIHESDIRHQVFSSSGVQAVGVGAEVTIPMLGGGGMSFKSSCDKAALLVLPQDAKHERIQTTEPYETYILTHVRSWEKRTRELGLKIRAQDFMLVTGRTMTKSWANAAFVNVSFEAEAKLQVELSTSLDAACRIEWRNTAGVQVNWGPSPGRPASDRNEPSTSDSPLNTVTENNQCIFLHRIRVKPSRKWLGLRLVAAAETQDFEGDDEDDEDRAEQACSELIVEPDHEEYSDYLDSILDYILKNATDVDYAVARDDDLLPYLDEIKQGVDVETLVERQQPVIFMDLNPESGLAFGRMQHDLVEKGAIHTLGDTNEKQNELRKMEITASTSE
ncbi:hypothetical protein OF83DRAFT_1147446 [Amylostereum chailletii]|nr:hypothetical protein OF83DRAFT_1147446 [Amylostereum chailletii]